MPLKDILVAFSSGSTSQNVLKFGLSLSEQAEASVTALHVAPIVMEEMQISTWMPEKLMQRVKDANEAAPQKAKDAMEALLAQLGKPDTVKWRVETGNVADALASHSRLHDLLVVGKYSETTEETGTHVRSEHIVTRSGRPLVVVPRDWETEQPIERIVIAWDGGLTATRAMNDALLMLPFVKHIDVLSITKADPNKAPLVELKAHLALHNPRITLTTVKPSGNTADQILQYCQDKDADILVVGSRGSARLRSGLVHGGAGRSILDDATLPVMISH